MRLINGERDWKRVSMQMVVTFSTSCGVACLTFKLLHNTTGSFQSHQRLEETVEEWSQGSAVTFFQM